MLAYAAVMWQSYRSKGGAAVMDGECRPPGSGPAHVREERPPLLCTQTGGVSAQDTNAAATERQIDDGFFLIKDRRVGC
jgi:hypothetical protein